MRGFAYAVVVLLAAWAVACGGGDDVDTSLDPGTDDFVYESTSDRGSKKNVKAVLAQFRKVQRAFYADDAEAVCATFDRKYAGFDPDWCVTMVDEVADRVQEGKERWPMHEVAWVRIYSGAPPGVDAIGTVTVIDGDELLRVGFFLRDGRWLSGFDVPADLEGLNTRLRADS